MYISLYLSRPQSASALGACRSDFPSLVNWVWGKTDLPKVLCFMNKCSVESNARNWLANRYQLATTLLLPKHMVMACALGSCKPLHAYHMGGATNGICSLTYGDLPKPETDGGGSSDSTYTQRPPSNFIPSPTEAQSEPTLSPQLTNFEKYLGLCTVSL